MADLKDFIEITMQSFNDYDDNNDDNKSRFLNIAHVCQTTRMALYNNFLGFINKMIFFFGGGGDFFGFF